jgi:hypothetical protein
VDGLTVGDHDSPGSMASRLEPRTHRRRDESRGSQAQPTGTGWPLATRLVRGKLAYMDFQAEQQDLGGPLRSLDGDGKGDHDQPYRFGRRPRASVPFPPRPAQRGFNTRQYARLLILRSRLEQRWACQDEFSTAARGHR